MTAGMCCADLLLFASENRSSYEYLSYRIISIFAVSKFFTCAAHSHSRERVRSHMHIQKHRAGAQKRFPNTGVPLSSASHIFHHIFIQRQALRCCAAESILRQLRGEPILLSLCTIALMHKSFAPSRAPRTG